MKRRGFFRFIKDVAGSVVFAPAALWAESKLSDGDSRDLQELIYNISPKDTPLMDNFSEAEIAEGIRWLNGK